MKTRLILKPGQRGTKSLVEKYGDALLYVRFRYDAKLRKRLKTIELVVEKTDWTPPPPQYAADTLVTLRIEATDTTPLFGFKDDIVIRITPLEAASRVDVRSASREGLGDLGTNARRIRAFYREMARRG